MNFENYEFRCSAIGKILSKSGKFTDGNKTYIEEVFAGVIHNVQKEINSKFFEKGLFEEESGITLLQNTLHKGELILKNKQRKHNGFIHGEFDCITKSGIVYDIKNAWDCFTFEKSDLTHDYKWQLISYAWLTGAKKARLFYCLNDTPEHILVQEEKKLFYSGNYIHTEDSNYINNCNELRKKHIHSHKPLEERFKVWDIEFTDDDFECIKQAVINARVYLQELYDKRQLRLKENLSLMDNLIV